MSYFTIMHLIRFWVFSCFCIALWHAGQLFATIGSPLEAERAFSHMLWAVASAFVMALAIPFAFWVQSRRKSYLVNKREKSLRIREIHRKRRTKNLKSS